MTNYVLTVISHGDKLDTNIVDKTITDFGVVTSESKVLSPRATDYYFTTDNREIIDLKIKETVDKAFGYDIILQKVDERSNKKLVIFDMDSTLIYQEVIELIAAYANIEHKVAEITTRAMNGEIDFTESLKQRVLLLKGIDSTTIWEELKHKINITHGAKKLCKVLKNSGFTLGVCSGGFIPLAEYIKTELGLDYAFANVLGVTEDNILDGTVIGETVDGMKKAELLARIAEKHNINPKHAVAVGDGANDLKMMEVAGFGIAWNAKPSVQKQAPAKLNSKYLLDILYILGYTDLEIETLQG